MKLEAISVVLDMIDGDCHLKPERHINFCSNKFVAEALRLITPTDEVKPPTCRWTPYTVNAQVKGSGTGVLLLHGIIALRMAKHDSS